MKFLNKINLQYLITFTVLLILATITGYWLLVKILKNEMYEDLYEKEYAIIQEIKSSGALPNLYPIIEVKKINKEQAEPKSYKELYLNDEAEAEEEPYMEYTNSVTINGQYYLIKIRHSLLENNDLLMAIALPLLILLLLLFFISYVVTTKLNKTIWRDFEFNLKEIENFSFNKTKPLSLRQTKIEEFDRLNKTIKALTKKLQQDYQTLKEFTENASHEIQTPLSIILLNLEELLQQDLPKPAFEKVVSSINNVKRLSTLNKSLLLIARIENKQFQTDKLISLSQVLSKKIEDFTPLIQKKNLTLDFKKTGDFMVNLDYELAGILINNLLSNTIRHNIENGKIIVEIDKSGLKICNTGNKTSLTNKTIFNRFTKENSQSYGLGLAIVKQICDSHHLQVSFVKDKYYCFTINHG